MTPTKLCTAALLALSATACMSTKPPVIARDSTDVYQFDANKSFALNVAHMSRKTAGLSDVAEAEQAQFKANRALVGAEYSAAFLTGGVVDLLGSMASQSAADKKFAWKPAHVYVTKLNEADLDNDAFNVVKAGLASAFDKISGAEFVGLYRVSSDHLANNVNVLYKGILCDALPPEKRVNYERIKEVKTWINFGAEIDGACGITAHITVPGKLREKGGLKDVVHLEFQRGLSLVDKLALATSGYALVPASYLDPGSWLNYKVRAPYVVHNNTMWFFTTDNTSSPVPQTVLTSARLGQ
ncbi:hypothetical protein [Pseudoalteromonas rubra]|uniref:Lipoprotein n=1 Tax=Pseudoalteromonas rubra TaxID=43658 RepID=A0A0U3IS13_9GAMM|nr:hypothetical protein [Pseudoalteromonas rubra]ALU46124.1 hypothetical protein AT705_24490 [Pseudoalteromonas rubra]